MISVLGFAYLGTIVVEYDGVVLHILHHSNLIWSALQRRLLGQTHAIAVVFQRRYNEGNRAQDNACNLKACHTVLRLGRQSLKM
jgi:hypothetical protein